MAIVQGTINTLYTETLNAPAGAVAATGYFDLTGQPANNDSFTLNGLQIQFKTSGAIAGSDQLNIGVDLAATQAALLTYLNTNPNARTQLSTIVVTKSGNRFTVTYGAKGTAGNSYTLVKFGTNLAVSGATLTGGAAQGPVGSFNVVGTDSGAMIAARVDETWEDNCVSLMAVIGATVELMADPASDMALARQQRKALNDVLTALAAGIKTVASAADDRTATATFARKAAIAAINKPSRPLTL